MAQGQTHGGKGSAVRPTDKKKFENNYDAIFGKKKKTGREEPCGSELLEREKEKKQDEVEYRNES